MSDLAKERALAGTQDEKETLWPLKEDAGSSGVIKLWTEKIRWAKTQQELDLATAIEVNKNVYINKLATWGDLRGTSILYQMQRETQWEIIWKGWDIVFFVSVSNCGPVTLHVTSPLSGRKEQGAEWRPHNLGQNDVWPATPLSHTRRSVWGWMGSMQGYWGSSWKCSPSLFPSLPSSPS